MKKSFFYLVAALLFFFSAVAHEPVKATLIVEQESIQPGQPFWIALLLNIDAHWHAYWKNPGDSGKAPDLEWQLPSGFSVDEIAWPYPTRFDLNTLSGYGYTGEVWLLAKITPPDSLQEKEVEIGAEVDWLVCSDQTCLPGSSNSKLKLAVNQASPKLNQQYHVGFEKARSQIPSKKWKAIAQRKDGIIHLNLQSAVQDFSRVTKADFFPEHNQMVDSKNLHLLPASKSSSGLTLLLKDKDQKNSLLKGVVVLETESTTHPVEIEVVIADAAPGELVFSNHDPIPNEFEGQFGLALILAFVGGLLLNLMPCVLPVISLKILNFVKISTHSRPLILKHGLAFSFGVLLSFWVLAGLMLMLQTYGHSMGWGFQLQEPLFVAFLAALLLVFALSLFGVFELGTSVTQLASQTESQQITGLLGSFLNGVLATAVATPCTGPFLGSAVGFAVTLSPFWALLIFTSLGLGMASPYLILSAYPHLMCFVPKPGPWMMVFKEIMGFLMLASVLWLVWVFGAQTSSSGLVILLSSFLFLAFGCWIYGTWGTPLRTAQVRIVSYILSSLCFLATGYLIFSGSTLTSSEQPLPSVVQAELAWQPFSTQELAKKNQEGKPVFVDFTAKWCLICQANHLILTSPAVADKFAKLGVVLMKADWTRNDPEITKALRQFGRNGVPLYLLYGTHPKESPTILPQVLTPDIVLKHLETLEKQMADAKQ